MAVGPSRIFLREKSDESQYNIIHFKKNRGLNRSKLTIIRETASIASLIYMKVLCECPPSTSFSGSCLNRFYKRNNEMMKFAHIL